MFRVRIGTVGALVAVASMWLGAQSATPAKPGPEHKKMESWVGTWATEGNAKASPFSPAGKTSGTSRVEWGPGGFTVLMNSDGKSPAGSVKGIGILAYDSVAKAYTYYGVDSTSDVGTATVTVSGDTWSFKTEDKMGGKTIKGRFTATFTSPTSYTYKYEMVDDKGVYSTVEEGKGTKTK